MFKSFKPEWVIIENTLLCKEVWFEKKIDMESEKFEVQPFIIPACSKNSPHRRDNIQFLQAKTKGVSFLIKSEPE